MRLQYQAAIMRMKQPPTCQGYVTSAKSLAQRRRLGQCNHKHLTCCFLILLQDAMPVHERHNAIASTAGLQSEAQRAQLAATVHSLRDGHFSRALASGEVHTAPVKGSAALQDSDMQKRRLARRLRRQQAEMSASVAGALAGVRITQYTLPYAASAPIQQTL